MALCDLSARNPNVLYELGLRQAYDLPVVLVKDEKTSTIFDVSGINTVEYNSHRLVEHVNRAIEDIAEALIATKEGKETTIAKIVKAKSANFSDVEVSGDDNITIMLNSIMTDIKSLKKGHENSSNNKANTKKDNYPINDTKEYHNILKLKDGVTDREIKTIIEFSEQAYNSRIDYGRLGPDLVIEIRNSDNLSMLSTVNYIKDHLEKK